MSASEDQAREALQGSALLNAEADRRDERMRMRDNGRVRFDPTINLGHILTFAAMVVGVMSSYSLLDKRVVVLEVQSSNAKSTADAKETQQKDSINEIRADVKELQRSVNEISRVLAGRHP